MTLELDKPVELARLALSAYKQIDNEVKERVASLPSHPGDNAYPSGETANERIEAAVKAGIITPKTGAEVHWLVGMAMRNIEMASKGRRQDLSDEIMSRAAQAEQLVSSDIAVSRNTPLVGEE
jgi:hypothetical protein